jgi:hypothetical protein
MKKSTIIMFVALLVFMGFSVASTYGQTVGYWDLTGTKLQNIMSYNGITINELWLNTNNNTRMRIYGNGQYQINPWSGAGGYISTPSGQADYATLKILAGGRSGLVSYSFQDADWGQNIQSYVGRANTVSYAVKWNGSDRFYVAGQGWLYANGAWFSSDRSLKDNITPLKSSLDRILKLKGYSYKFKTERLCAGGDSTTSTKIDQRTDIGLMADEVEKVVPEVVRTIENNKKAIAYQNLVALLIEAMKEQQTQIRNLENQLSQLKKEIK